MPSCCRGNACTGRACVAGRWGPGLLRRARCVRSANGRLWCWGHRIGHGAFRIRPARRRDRRTAGPLPARGRVRGDALSTCMDCGLVSGACLWLSYIRRTASRRRPGVGNRRWSIPCTSIPHIGKKCPACSGYVTREVPQTSPSHLWATGVTGVAAYVGVLFTSAPRVSRGSMPDRDDYSECSWI